MFGIKTNITENLIKDDDDLSINHSKKNEKDAKFIFYNDDKKFSKQIEIFAVLNSSETSKVLVVADNTASMDFLSIKIAESFDQFPEYHNLTGLKAINLTKKSDKQNDILLPTTGALKDCVINGDVIYCDLITNEYWVKVTITISEGISPSVKLTLSIDLKTTLNSQFKKFKYILLKCAINCWLEHRKTKESKNYHYVIKNVKFSTTHQGEFNLNGNKADKIDQMYINEIFDFKSEIKCYLALVSLEEMLCEELKSVQIDYENSSNRLRWGEFKMTDFSMMIQSRKFNPEIEFIFRYVKKLFNPPNEQLEQKVYVYYKENETWNPKGNSVSEFDSNNISHLVNVKDKFSIVIVPDESNSGNTFIKDNNTNSINNIGKRKRGMSNTNLKSMEDNERRKSISSIASNRTSEYNNNLNEEINIDGEIPFQSGNRVKRQVENITARLKKYRDTSRFSNLCKDFNKLLNKDKFIESFCQIYKLNVPKNILEIIPMPEFRNFTILPGDFLSKKGSFEVKEDNFDEIRANNRNVIIFTVLLFTTSFYLMYLVLDKF